MIEQKKRRFVYVVFEDETNTLLAIFETPEQAEEYVFNNSSEKRLLHWYDVELQMAEKVEEEDDQDFR